MTPRTEIESVAAVLSVVVGGAVLIYGMLTLLRGHLHERR